MPPLMAGRKQSHLLQIGIGTKGFGIDERRFDPSQPCLYLLARTKMSSEPDRDGFITPVDISFDRGPTLEAAWLIVHTATSYDLLSLNL